MRRSEETSSILFLDFDGVLNGRKFLRACNYNEDKPMSALERDTANIDPAALAILHKIYVEVPYSIVITSTWRRLYSPGALYRMLRTRGLHDDVRVVDVTPTRGVPMTGDRLLRSSEINHWLTSTGRHYGVTSYAIVDDDSDAGMEGLGERFVRTQMEDGLTESDAARLIEILRRPL